MDDANKEELFSVISNLYDIVEKFGVIDIDDNVIRFSSGDLGLNYKLYISKSTKSEYKNMMVSKNLITHAGLKIFQIDKGIISWDKTLTLEQAKNAIEKIDELANRAGLIDINGQRIDISIIDKNEGVYKVDDIFTKKGMAFIIPPGKDPEQIIKQFDKPEKLNIVKKPFGIFLQLKEDSKYMENREKIVMELLKEKGIKLDDIKNVSWDTIMELRDEIKRRLEVLNVKK